MYVAEMYERCVGILIFKNRFAVFDAEPVLAVISGPADAALAGYPIYLSAEG